MVSDPRELAHRMHDAFNARDVDAIDDIFAPDFFSHPLQAGRDALKAAWTQIIAAYPRARSEVADVLVDGDRVALRAASYGLSADPDATDDTPPATLLEIFRVADGRIAELWAGGTVRLPALD